MKQQKTRRKITKKITMNIDTIHAVKKWYRQTLLSHVNSKPASLATEATKKSPDFYL